MECMLQGGGSTASQMNLQAAESAAKLLLAIQTKHR
jgi:hypothetical protein